MPRRSRPGTAIRKGWDVKRIGKGLAAQGMDLRHWFSYGTVGTVGGDDGPNFSDGNAVVISPAGIDVDVILEPSGYHCPCRWGMQHGSVYICTPIHAGDQVLVGIPDGDVSMVPQVLQIIPGASDPIPVGGDGLPIFKNDRALIMARGVPVDIRTDGGAQMLVNPDGTVVINAGSKGAARLDDEIVATLAGATSGGAPLPGSIQALAAAILATGLFTPNPSPPPPPPQPDFQISGKITAASGTVKVGG